jgi:hypothetical protein
MQKVSRQVSLVIQMDRDTGKVQIQGPFDNADLCFEILEKARQLIAKRAAMGNKVIIPDMVPPNDA